MAQEDARKLIFRYQPAQLRPAFYIPVAGVFQLAMLHYIAPGRYDIRHHPYFYGLWLLAVVAFSMGIYLYRRSYRIAMGQQGLIVSSWLGTKMHFYMRLRRVELAPTRRGSQQCRLEVIDDQGAPVIKIFGDKPDMERVARDLSARVRPFG